MIEFAHFVYVAFLPSIVFGLALAFAWRYIKVGPLRTTMQWIASLLFFVPQPFALFLGSYSTGLRVYQQALLSLLGFGVGALMFAKLLSRPSPAAREPGLLKQAAVWRQTDDEIRKTESVISALRRVRAPQRPLVLAIGAIAMTTLGVYCGWNTVGDYLLNHDIVVGRVEGARVIGNTRSPNTYQVIIDHRPYNITLDLLVQLNRGDYVNAEVGIASRTIVAIQSVTH